MAHKYQCYRCGCSLDPHEGRYCEECLKELEEESRQRKAVFGQPARVPVRYDKGPVRVRA